MILTLNCQRCNENCLSAIPMHWRLKCVWVTSVAYLVLTLTFMANIVQSQKMTQKMSTGFIPYKATNKVKFIITTHHRLHLHIHVPNSPAVLINLVKISTPWGGGVQVLFKLNFNIKPMMDSQSYIIGNYIIWLLFSKNCKKWLQKNSNIQYVHWNPKQDAYK